MHKSTTGYLSSAYIRSERRHAPTAASRPSGRFRYICKNSERSMKRLLTTFADPGVASGALRRIHDRPDSRRRDRAALHAGRGAGHGGAGVRRRNRIDRNFRTGSRIDGRHRAGNGRKTPFRKRRHLPDRQRRTARHHPQRHDIQKSSEKRTPAASPRASRRRTSTPAPK